MIPVVQPFIKTRPTDTKSMKRVSVSNSGISSYTQALTNIEFRSDSSYQNIKDYQLFIQEEEILYDEFMSNGLSFALAYSSNSTEDTPQIIAKGIDEKKQPFEKLINVNLVNPYKATIVEIRALETHIKKIDNTVKVNYLNSLLPSNIPITGVNEKVNYIEFLNNTINSVSSFTLTPDYKAFIESSIEIFLKRFNVQKNTIEAEQAININNKLNQLEVSLQNSMYRNVITNIVNSPKSQAVTIKDLNIRQIERLQNFLGEENDILLYAFTDLLEELVKYNIISKKHIDAVGTLQDDYIKITLDNSDESFLLIDSTKAGALNNWEKDLNEWFDYMEHIRESEFNYNIKHGNYYESHIANQMLEDIKELKVLIEELLQVEIPEKDMVS